MIEGQPVQHIIAIIKRTNFMQITLILWSKFNLSNTGDKSKDIIGICTSDFTIFKYFETRSKAMQNMANE